MSELMENYIGKDKEKRKLIEELIDELKISGMSDENIKIVVDNFIKNHEDEQSYLRYAFSKENYEDKKRKI